MTASSLPAVQVSARSPLLGAGLGALLLAAGLPVVAEGGEVLVLDDGWLDDPDALTEVWPEGIGVVAVGSPAWAEVLAELAPCGWAALPLDATPGELLAGVLGAAAGLAVLPPALVPAPAPPAGEEGESPLPTGDVTLTPRERDVLALLAEGLSNKRAARELGVTESTVKFHVQAVYSKLGVQSRAAAVARGIQLGLVSV